MPRQRHFVNVGRAGDTVFVTTTVLDFVLAFDRPELRTRMVSLLYRHCRLTATRLHAYVVMPHHIHLLVLLGTGVSIRAFMQRLKEDGCKELRPLLTAAKDAEFSMQRGLNRSVFWQRSFRSFVVESEATFWQKARYIHENSVRAGLCAAPEEYLWSSARAFADGLWSEERGLPLDADCGAARA